MYKYIPIKKTNRNLVAFIMSFGVFIWSFSAGIVTIALPTISQYLDVSTSLVSWVVVAHLLVLTSFLLIFGKIGDYVGYKKIFLGGLFLFTVGSFLFPNYNTHIIFYSLIVLIFFYVNLFLDTIPSNGGLFISYYYFFDRDMLKLVEFERMKMSFRVLLCLVDIDQTYDI
ncbi:MFS transporter [Methanobacterium sp. SMA-27]|uniref:MFS transporter n=1 Tax=Methanobacterium sp. SMA-27 TaxID=1495336 RepID=UPI00064FADA0|nr:MFS transporter [Methanobacterium sp. SMA-27]